MKSSRPDWTPDELDLLRKLWREGLSASQIGRQLGKTRAAVCGQRHRLGLPVRRTGVRCDLGRRPAYKSANGKSKGRKGSLRLSILEPAPDGVHGDDLPGGVSFMALQSGMCRWPVSGSPPHRFCGEPQREGCSYCEEHAARAYVQPIQKYIVAPREYNVMRVDFEPQQQSARAA